MARFSGWRLTRAGFIFIIVTLLLAVVVFAGVRFAQQRGEQVRQEQAEDIARQTQSDTPVIAEDESPAPEATEQPQAANNGVVASNGAAQTAPEALPQTGASDFLPILLLAVATYGAVLAVRQRQSMLANTFEG